MINFYNILTEGRYDSITRKISNDIFYIVKETKNNPMDKHEIELPSVLTNDEVYLHESGLELSVIVYIERLKDVHYGENKISFHVNSYINNDEDIVVEISLDVDDEPQMYEELFYKINEDVRHEIEHYTQEMFHDREQSDIEFTAEYETTYQHHKDPSEVEALVHGFYRRAKLEKKPLDIIMWNDLNSDISKNLMTQEEAQDLFKTWINYARRRLPHAIYSTK